MTWIQVHGMFLSFKNQHLWHLSSSVFKSKLQIKQYTGSNNGVQNNDEPKQKKTPVYNHYQKLWSAWRASANFQTSGKRHCICNYLRLLFQSITKISMYTKFSDGRAKLLVRIKHKCIISEVKFSICFIILGSVVQQFYCL